VDIRLGGEYDTLVITGPNTGGKTVTLKTLGLLCAMAQCGLHIPAADGSVVPVFDGVLADIGDEQSIEQSLSTFSSHMTNIVGILDVCGDGHLLLLDELGAGTDPVEGAALAMAVIEHARRKGALIAATTHYAELKTYAMTAPGVVNASCEFDVETLRPTYKLITGIPGKSNAFAISRRLGLPEEVVEDAMSRVNTESAAFEDALAALEDARRGLERDRLEAAALLRDAKEDRRSAEELRARLDSDREKAALVARREASRIIDDARKAAEDVMSGLREMQRRAAEAVDAARLNEDKAELFRRLNEAEDAVGAGALGGGDGASLDGEGSEGGGAAARRVFAVGDRVRLRGIGTVANVVAVGSDGVLSLQAGAMKITVGAGDVEHVDDENGGGATEAGRRQGQSNPDIRRSSASRELDLRGMVTDDALPLLERFLDEARMGKLDAVTVIHGKGTGAMRQAVHQYLRGEQRLVKSFRLGRYGEGEDGVTIVEMR
jgi:DNA mismatch repair protein MutS2